MTSYSIVRQHSIADCGPAALGTIAKHYGRFLSLNRLREMVGTIQNGTTLLGLKQGAEKLGFNTRAVQASLEAIKSQVLPLPIIIHWEGNHWVVLYGQKGNKYVVADPGAGIRYLSEKRLLESWSNSIMLLLEPDPIRFYAQSDDSVEIEGVERFVRRVWPYRNLLAQAFLLNCVLGVLSLTSPILMQILTDQVLEQGNVQLLAGIGIAVSVMYLVSSTIEFVQSNLIAHFAQRLELGLVLEFIRQILHLPLKYYESRRSGELASRLEDIQQINHIISQVVISLPSEFFIAVISLGFMAFYSGKLTMAALVIAFVMTLSTLVFLPALAKKSQKVLEVDADNQGILIETLKGILSLKTIGAATVLWEELQSRFGRLANLSFSMMQIGYINSIFSRFVERTGSLVLLWLGSQLVIQNQLTVGQLLAFHAMNMNFTALIGTLVDFVDELIQAMAANERLMSVISETPEIPSDSKKPSVILPTDRDIICENLSFHYEDKLNRHHEDELDRYENKFNGIKDLTLTLPNGQIIALIGFSGSGKSTLAKLLTGLYLPDAGNISIGPYNLKDIDPDCWRQQVVLVPQHPDFWSRTILENFQLRPSHIPFEKIVEACQITGADEFIRQLPGGYNTVLGEFGANISGGQRQRLAIARAIVHDPPILILDESTSALDPDGETQVLNNLLSHRQQKTTILISHSPKVNQRADWIVMLEQGQLKQQGSYAELVNQPGDHLVFLKSSVKS